MTFGLSTWKADGTKVVSPFGKGGVFVAVHTQTRADGSGSVSYPNLIGRSLRVVQVYAGDFTWVVGVNGSNHPTITFTMLPETENGDSIKLMVFAV